jgi:hypothetical protein
MNNLDFLGGAGGRSANVNKEKPHEEDVEPSSTDMREPNDDAI